jgi:Fur family ferric uptake transcriptional regulator
MTSASTHAPVETSSIAAAEERLRAAGMRVSAARRRVLEVLLGSAEPLRADQIAEALGEHGDISSVYRNLERFEELGIVRHVHLGHAPGLYALNTGSRLEYLVCERCNRVQAVEPAALDAAREAVRTGLGFEARFDHFPLAGLCRECAAA